MYENHAHLTFLMFKVVHVFIDVLRYSSPAPIGNYKLYSAVLFSPAHSALSNIPQPGTNFSQLGLQSSFCTPPRETSF